MIYSRQNSFLSPSFFRFRTFQYKFEMIIRNIAENSFTQNTQTDSLMLNFFSFFSLFPLFFKDPCGSFMFKGGKRKKNFKKLEKKKVSYLVIKLITCTLQNVCKYSLFLFLSPFLFGFPVLTPPLSLSDSYTK